MLHHRIGHRPRSGTTAAGAAVRVPEPCCGEPCPVPSLQDIAGRAGSADGIGQSPQGSSGFSVRVDDSLTLPANAPAGSSFAVDSVAGPRSVRCWWRRARLTTLSAPE